ncbi:MAG TPA: ankyrin repeat domain-containing protein [Chlamydiales bacterium]|nr:ankyrin repeat domain-containing protein [Chlamydiales bacterium]
MEILFRLCYTLPLMSVNAVKYPCLSEMLQRHYQKGRWANLKDLENYPRLASLKLEGGNLLIHVAVCCNQLEIVKCLAENGADINDFDQNYETPLILATKAKYTDIMAWLLKNGASTSFSDNQKNGPLHFAAEHIDVLATQLLVENYADVNQQNSRGNTPLHIAVWESSASQVDFLLSNGADSNLQNKDGNTPLHIAAAIGRLDIVKNLYQRGAKAGTLNKCEFSASDIALCNSHYSCYDYLEKQLKTKTIPILLEVPERVYSPPPEITHS